MILQGFLFFDLCILFRLDFSFLLRIIQFFVQQFLGDSTLLECLLFAELQILIHLLNQL